MSITAGILTIGNEVVDGQITNRNASWLASQLAESGFEVSTHLSVKDTQTEILQALQFLEKRCQVILTTGGLGPTTDDLTRYALARWNNTSMETCEDQWEEIQSKLKSRGVTLRQGHKTQAEFPQGSTPLANSKGVAPGFFFKKGQNFIAALPGPPRELKAIWNESLNQLLIDEFSPKKNKKLYTWICMGAPESEIAHTVEELIKEQGSDFGFRLHKPYVEVKIWANENLTESLQALFRKISEQLKPWHVGTSIQNIRERFYERLENYSQIYIVDHLSGGLFVERLKEYKLPENMRYQTYFDKMGKPQFFKKESCLEIVKHLNIGEHSLCIGLFPQSTESSLLIINDQAIEVSLPAHIPSTSQLGKLYAIETLFSHHYTKLREKK